MTALSAAVARSVHGVDAFWPRNGRLGRSRSGLLRAGVDGSRGGGPVVAERARQEAWSVRSERRQLAGGECSSTADADNCREKIPPARWHSPLQAKGRQGSLAPACCLHAGDGHRIIPSPNPHQLRLFGADTCRRITTGGPRRAGLGRQWQQLPLPQRSTARQNRRDDA